MDDSLVAAAAAVTEEICSAKVLTVPIRHNFRACFKRKPVEFRTKKPEDLSGLQARRYQAAFAKSKTLAGHACLRFRHSPDRTDCDALSE